MRFARSSLHVGHRLAKVASVCIAGVMPCASAGDEVRMSLDEARGASAQALLAGQADMALVLADGVLLGAPDDTQALMIKSRALRQLGRTQDAADAAKQAFAQSDDARTRFFAALLMAQARSTGGNHGMAQLWLRRAAQIAPDDELRATALRDFRHVRQYTPWRLSLNMSVEPSDNLNGAPKTDSFTFGGLTFVNPSAVPLSGERFVFGADYLRRMPLSDTTRLNFGASIEVQRVRFSQEARDKMPGIDNNDYRQESLGLSFGYEARAQDGSWLGKSDLSVTRHWLGGTPYADDTRLDLSFGKALAPGLTGATRFAYEIEQRHDLSLRDSQTYEMGATLTKRIGGSSLALDLRFADTTSDSRLVARESGRVAVSYGLGKPVKGMLPSVTLAWEVTDYDRSPASFWVDPRRDEDLSLSVNVLLPELNYYGFAPEIGVSFRDRNSNYTLYETRGTDLRLGLKSVF